VNIPTPRQQQISARILALVASGMTIREAIDATLGEGTFITIAGEIYDALTSKGNLVDVRA
jgi:hypothetical protein